MTNNSGAIYPPPPGLGAYNAWTQTTGHAPGTPIEPLNNPYPIGSAQWISYQQNYGYPTDVEAVKAQKELWLETVNKKATTRAMKFPLLVPVGTRKRRVFQQKFTLDFDRVEDIQLRLYHTIVTIGQNLYYVNELLKVDGKWVLVVQDGDRQSYRVPYEDVDLRTPEPQYYLDGDTPMFYFRLPSRQQSQGLNGRCVVTKKVGEANALTLQDTYRFMKGMGDTNPVLWSPAYADVIVKLKALRALRLSPSIAFYREDDRLMAEYRSRRLGEVHDDEIYVDEDDYARPWIKKEAQRIGCVLKNGG